MPFPAGCYPKSQKPLSAPFVGPLDGYKTGAKEMWDVARRVLGSYTGPLINVRRSSDDATMDIGYDANSDLDTVALLAFCGAGDGFVTKVYGQLNGINLVQASAAAQRRIVSSGVVVTDSAGAPAMEATSNDTQGYVSDTFTAYSGTNASVFCRFQVAPSAYVNSRVIGLGGSAGVDYTLPSAITIEGNGGGSIQGETYGTGSPGALASVSVSLSTQTVASSIFDGTNHTMRAGASSNNIGMTGTLNVTRVWAAGAYSDTSFTVASGDKWGAACVYFNDQTSNDAAIRAAMTP